VQLIYLSPVVTILRNFVVDGAGTISAYGDTPTDAEMEEGFTVEEIGDGIVLRAAPSGDGKCLFDHWARSG
jgi:hypothetical protein